MGRSSGPPQHKVGGGKCFGGDSDPIWPDILTDSVIILLSIFPIVCLVWPARAAVAAGRPVDPGADATRPPAGRMTHRRRRENARRRPQGTRVVRATPPPPPRSGPAGVRSRSGVGGRRQGRGHGQAVRACAGRPLGPGVRERPHHPLGATSGPVSPPGVDAARVQRTGSPGACSARGRVDPARHLRPRAPRAGRRGSPRADAGHAAAR